MTRDISHIEIKSLIPHREPFLLIDRLVSYTQGESLTALKSVTRSEPWFQGHFPDYPIMPGVLVTEALAQTCAAFSALELQAEDTEKAKDTLYILLRTDIRYPKAVKPGCTLQLQAMLTEKTSAFDTFKVRATSDDGVCVRGTITVATTTKLI